MTLTPASLRLDLKCGKGAISEGEKCTKGAAQRVQPKRARNGAKKWNLKKAAKTVGTAALIAGAISVGRGYAILHGRKPKWHKRRDSIYATGFSADSGSFDI